MNIQPKEAISPNPFVITHEAPEIRFQPFVHVFGLPIRLGAVGCAPSQIRTLESKHLPPKITQEHTILVDKGNP